MNPEVAGDSPGSSRRAHVAWAVVGVIVCLLLIVTGRKGHPPAVIFLPHVLVAWAVGHGLLWGAQRLAARGRGAAAETGAGGQHWPVELRLVAFGMGAAALVGVAQVVGTILNGSWYPYLDARLWTAMLVVWLVHAACFAGLLLRRRWCRMLSAVIVVGWAALLGRQVAEQLTGRPSSNTAELLIASGLMVLLLLFGAYLASSARVKDFLVR